MIKNFLVINFTGKNNLIGLCYNNNFFIKKLQTNITNNNETLVQNIMDLMKINNLKIDNTFSIIVNVGPGSFSSIRSAISVAKGIQISKGIKLYSYKNSQLTEFNQANIEYLIKKNLLENNLIKPLYLS
ncbi:MAG: hypothetical protein ACJZ4O_04575 [Pelagibacteraceae bacterium]